MNSYKRVFRSAACASVAAVALIPCLALAQESSDAPAKEKDSDIIVTGTLIRGKAPVGSNAITLGANRIQEVGAQSGNDLLASVPQVTNYFNKLPVSDLAIEVSQLNIARPNLRNISPNSAASSATLVLVDGHRVATAGVNQASVDPDLIPIGAIERVDVVTEGGSATYGTDAVAGVINYITRRRFEGVEVGGHFGFADNYKQWDVKATVGKTWDTGSAWLSYSYAQSDALFGRDRAYHRNVDYATLPYVGRDIQCPTPNVSYGAFAPLANRIFNGGTIPNPALTCDNSENASFVPRAERHGGMIGLSQDIGDKTSIDVRAYYSQRDTLAVGDLASPVAVGGNNAYASQLPAGIPSTFVVGQPVVLFGFLPAVNQVQVNFNLRPLLGDGSQRSTTTIKQWGANAEFRHDLTEDWQIKGLVNWGQSDSSYLAGQISPARLVQAGAPPVGATTANSFNPFNVTANNAALIADLIDSQRFGQAKNELFNVRAIAEGKLFELPGGDVRMAVGAEYIHETLQKRASTDVRASGVAALPFSTYKRHVESLFAEVQAPLFLNGEGDPMLTVSGAVRYDHYSDFGNTTNPKFGATFKLVHWLTLRGNWGTSFTAPTPLDQLGSLANFTSFNTFVAFSRPGETALPNSGTAAIQGSLAGLQPQTATTWSIGADIQPVDGLRLSANYYSVHFKNILRTPFSNTPFTDFPANYQTKVTGFTPAEVAAFFGSTPGAAATIATIGNSTVYELVDFRTGNLGVLKVKGIDASLDYTHQTGFGSVDLSVNANRPLSRKAQVSPSSAIVDELLVENSKLALRVALGAKVGALRAQATVNHSAGYNITPITGIAVPQSRVGSFTVVNLFFKYDVPGDSMLLKDLSFTLNVDNLFDKDPPVLRRNNNNENGFANGFTLGRLINIGINKKF